jgi:uncharacterized Zn finger protein (UPF0148 family)
MLYRDKDSPPMIVECVCCGMTLVLPQAYLDKDGYVFCPSCCDEEDREDAD